MQAKTLCEPSTIVLILFLLACLSSLYHGQKKSRKRKAWQKALALPEHLQEFNAIYEAIDGFALSRQARTRHDVLDYIYGEIEFSAFIALLSLARPNPNTVFYDLGCGVGKAVLASAMVFPIQKAVGVELLPELYQAACQAQSQLTELKTRAKIHFILADFLTTPLAEANLIFINASSFFGTTWEKLCQRLDDLPQLTTVISTSKPLISSVFKPYHSSFIQMSWGIVPVYLHQRQTILPPDN